MFLLDTAVAVFAWVLLPPEERITAIRTTIARTPTRLATMTGVLFFFRTIVRGAWTPSGREGGRIPWTGARGAVAVAFRSANDGGAEERAEAGADAGAGPGPWVKAFSRHSAQKTLSRTVNARPAARSFSRMRTPHWLQ